jgi:syntaxin 7
MSLVAFQRAQQLSAEKQRTVIDGVKHAVDEEQERYASLPKTLRKNPLILTFL